MRHGKENMNVRQDLIFATICDRICDSNLCDRKKFSKRRELFYLEMFDGEDMLGLFAIQFAVEPDRHQGVHSGTN